MIKAKIMTIMLECPERLEKIWIILEVPLMKPSTVPRGLPSPSTQGVCTACSRSTPEYVLAFKHLPQKLSVLFFKLSDLACILSQLNCFKTPAECFDYLHSDEDFCNNSIGTFKRTFHPRIPPLHWPCVWVNRWWQGAEITCKTFLYPTSVPEKDWEV